MKAILALFGIALAAEIFGIVALYNTTVNLSHNIADAKTQLDAVGAQNTALSNTIVAALGSDELAKIAAADGLVAESHPQYFPLAQANQTNAKWPIASH